VVAPPAPSAPLVTGRATPGSADFIASATEPAPAVAAAPTPAVATDSASMLSPEDFPLDPSAPPKSWPRSAAPGGAGAELEGYLVRHSEMAGDDALGGFVPYLDVVAGEGATAPAAPAPAQERQ
jgi:hypothetical protein